MEDFKVVDKGMVRSEMMVELGPDTTCECIELCVVVNMWQPNIFEVV